MQHRHAGTVQAFPRNADKPDAEDSNLRDSPLKPPRNSQGGDSPFGTIGAPPSAGSEKADRGIKRGNANISDWFR